MPRALHQQGLLAGLVTDWYAFGKQNRKQPCEIGEAISRAGENRNEGTGSKEQRSVVSGQWSWTRLFGGRGRAARAARAEGIPDGLVRAFLFRSLLWKWRVRRLAAQGRSHEACLQTDSAFASAVARLKLPPHEVFFGYSYASLEMLAVEKKRGVLTVLDQIDPGAVEFQLVAEEMARFPELGGPPPEFPAAYYERNQREWTMADIIVVNSKWSRKALVKQGVPSEKLVVIPLAYEVNAEKQKAARRSSQPKTSRAGESGNVQPSTLNPQPSTAPLRVLWLGQVNVRKGIHYLMEAARKLEQEKIHFDVVGPIGILPAAVASAPRNLTFHGPVSRDRAADWYRKADLFVLPTLSDGFAITQLEAMSHGLPVITTPCCGDVVSDGVDGFIIPSRDADALARTLQRYLKESKLLLEQRIAAAAKSRQFTLDHLSANLLTLEAALGDRR